MIYAYDEITPMPINDLYDSRIMLQAINVAKDMYEKADLEMKDFKKEYGDFYSPFLKDVDWYQLNVTGKINNVVNDLYNRGIDPLRSPEGRAAVRQAINDIDVGRIARSKANAKIGYSYLEAMRDLQRLGKYDKNMQDYYLNSIGSPLFEDFSSENGLWTQASPIEAKSLKLLTEQSFNNRTAHLLTELDVKDFGLEYDPRGNYKGFTKNDLLDIANTVAPGLTGTVYYDYFRYLSKQKLIESGIKNPSESQINKLLAEDIANTLQEYIIKPDSPDYTDWYRNYNIKLKEQANNILKQRALSRQFTNNKNNSKTTDDKQQFDYQDFLIGTTAANVLSKTSIGSRIGVGGVSDYTPEKVSGFMGAALKELAEGIYNYNLQTPTKSGLNSGRSFNMIDYLWDKQRDNMLEKSGNMIDIGSRYGKTFNMGAVDMSAADLDVANKIFLSQMSIPSSTENFVQWTQRKPDTDNSDYVLMNLGADKGRIYSSDEVSLTSAGVNRPKDVPAAIEKTKRLRKNLEQRFNDGKTMMKSEGSVVGRVGNDGAFHVFQKIRIVNKDKYKNANNGDLQEFNYNNIYNEGEVIYYDMGADTQGNPNYSNDFMENMNPVVTDQSLGSDRAVLKSLGISNTNVKSDNSVPYLNYSSDEDDDDLLDLMGY